MRENVCFVHRRCCTYVETFKRYNGNVLNMNDYYRCIQDFDIALLAVASESFIFKKIKDVMTLMVVNTFLCNYSDRPYC